MSLHQCWLGFQAGKARFCEWADHFGFVFGSKQQRGISEACMHTAGWTFVEKFVGKEISRLHVAFLSGKRSFQDLLAMIARQGEIEKTRGTAKLPTELQTRVNHFVEHGEGREVLEEAVKRMHRMWSRIIEGLPRRKE